MFKVGEFARVLNISVRTLHHYEEVGLLRPHRDVNNDYRFYTPSDLALMQRILALRDMGFSLDRIRAILTDLPPADYHNLLRAQYDDLKREYDRISHQLRHLESQLKELPMTQPYKPEIRSIPAQRVAAASATALNYKNVAKPMEQLCSKIHRHLRPHQVPCVGPDIVIWSADYGEMNPFTLDFLIPIPDNATIPETPDIRIYTLPETPTMAVVQHQGSYEDLGQAFAALIAHIDTTAHTRSGPVREVYLHYDQDDAKKLTEIHIPVTPR